MAVKERNFFYISIMMNISRRKIDFSHWSLNELFKNYVICGYLCFQWRWKSFGKSWTLFYWQTLSGLWTTWDVEIHFKQWRQLPMFYKKELNFAFDLISFRKTKCMSIITYFLFTIIYQPTGSIKVWFKKKISFKSTFGFYAKDNQTNLSNAKKILHLVSNFNDKTFLGGQFSVEGAPQ